MLFNMGIYMKSFMNKFMLLFVSVCLLSTLSYANHSDNKIESMGKPIYNMTEPFSLPPILGNSNTISTVTYKIQNNMSFSLLGNVMRPIKGLQQNIMIPRLPAYCGYSSVENGVHPDRFDLGAKGTANDSCLLQLYVISSQIPAGGIHEQLVICGAPYVNCSKGPTININPIIVPAIISVAPDSINAYAGEALQWQVTNTSTSTAHQIRAYAGDLASYLSPFQYSAGCEALTQIGRAHV